MDAPDVPFRLARGGTKRVHQPGVGAPTRSTAATADPARVQAKGRIGTEHGLRGEVGDEALGLVERASARLSPHALIEQLNAQA